MNTIHDQTVWDAIITGIHGQLSRNHCSEVYQFMWGKLLAAYEGRMFRDDPDAFYDQLKRDLHSLAQPKKRRS